MMKKILCLFICLVLCVSILGVLGASLFQGMRMPSWSSGIL